jgi:LysM repeat protein
LIKDYNLQDYTLIAMNLKKPDDVIWASKTVETEVQEADRMPKQQVQKEEAKTIFNTVSYPSGVFKINQTNVVFIEKGTSYLAVAEEHQISLSLLFEFNDIASAIDVAGHDQLIFLQRKRKTGATEFHIVAEGETLHSIAQSEGVRLESILTYNSMKADMLPEAGEKIYLQSPSGATPKLKIRKGMISSFFEGEKKDEYLVHVVQPKETLYSITKKYSVSTDDVLKWNHLRSADLKTGQQLRINKKNNADN